MISPENTGPEDVDPPLSPRDPGYPALRESYIGAPAGVAPELIHRLLDEAQSCRVLIKTFTDSMEELAAFVRDATTRRRAALIGADLMEVRLGLDDWLGEMDAVDECADYLGQVLGPATLRDGPEVTAARIALSEVRVLVRVVREDAREVARIGRLATDRISGFAEAEMLYPQILRDLDRLDLAAADTRIARLAELDREVVARGTAATLAEVRRLRARVGHAHDPAGLTPRPAGPAGRAPGPAGPADGGARRPDTAPRPASPDLDGFLPPGPADGGFGPDDDTAH